MHRITPFLWFTVAVSWLSWQIIPRTLGRLLGDQDRAKAGRVMQAMLTMGKIDIAGLERAYDQA
jgi:hypothetical protein